MTHDTTPRQDARDLQARLYREIGISAVAAALRFTTQPDPAARVVSGPDVAPQPALDRPRERAARAA